MFRYCMEGTVTCLSWETKRKFYGPVIMDNYVNIRWHCIICNEVVWWTQKRMGMNKTFFPIFNSRSLHDKGSCFCTRCVVVYEFFCLEYSRILKLTFFFFRNLAEFHFVQNVWNEVVFYNQAFLERQAAKRESHLA